MKDERKDALGFTSATQLWVPILFYSKLNYLGSHPSSVTSWLALLRCFSVCVCVCASSVFSESIATLRSFIHAAMIQTSISCTAVEAEYLREAEAIMANQTFLGQTAILWLSKYRLLAATNHWFQGPHLLLDLKPPCQVFAAVHVNYDECLNTIMLVPEPGVKTLKFINYMPLTSKVFCFSLATESHARKM